MNWCAGIGPSARLSRELRGVGIPSERKARANLLDDSELASVEVTDQIMNERVMNELMGKEPSARFHFILNRAEEAEERDV